MFYVALNYNSSILTYSGMWVNFSKILENIKNMNRTLSLHTREGIFPCEVFLNCLSDELLLSLCNLSNMLIRFSKRIEQTLLPNVWCLLRLPNSYSIIWSPRVELLLLSWKFVFPKPEYNAKGIYKQLLVLSLCESNIRKILDIERMHSLCETYFAFYYDMHSLLLARICKG